MTPQLRRAVSAAILEHGVAAFVEEELERNPLLERDEREPAGPDAGLRADTLAPVTETADSAAAASDAMPGEAASPLDADYSNVYDSDSAAYRGTGGRSDFEDDLEGMDAIAAPHATLREHLAEQVRLTFHDHADRMIAGALLALVDPAGRLNAEDAAIARALGTARRSVARVRGLMQRFDPTGLFCRDLRECLMVQLQEKNRYDPAMAALLDNLVMLARRDARADGGLRRGCRGSRADGVRAEAARPQARLQLRCRARAGAGARRAAAPPARRQLVAGDQPGDDAPRAGQPRLPRARRRGHEVEGGARLGGQSGCRPHPGS